MSRLPAAWRACVGTGRMELALRRDHQDSLALIQREIGFRHIRGHGLFSDGMGIHRPFTHLGEEHVRHSFTYLDQVVDAYLGMGVRPSSPLPRQLETLREAAEPVRSHRGLPIVNGHVTLDLTLSRHEVTLLEITPVRDETPSWWDDGHLLGMPS